MEIKELIIDPDDMNSGVFATSVVDRPAMESHFVTLAKHDDKKKRQTFAEVNSEKQILMGAAMIPNKPIYRRYEDEEFYVFFSPSTVEACALSFAKWGYQNEATVMHEVSVDGCTVFESWIKSDEEKDKSTAFGIDVPVGTWLISMKVQNDDLWQKMVKTKEVMGFSIEGYFIDKAIKQKQQASKMNSAQVELQHLLASQILRNDVKKAKKV